MEPPIQLADWTFDTVLAVVEAHEYEPGRFDYKAALNATGEKKEDRDEHRASIQRTVCAMANTGGGLILFGVRDRRYEVTHVRDRVVGIPAHGDHRREFGQKIEAIQPEVHFDASPVLLRAHEGDERGVFVVAIPESPIRPHMVETTGAFYKRGDGGSAVRMDVYEVRDQMLFTQDRLAMVMLLRIRLVRFHRLAASINNFYPNYHLCVERFDVATYDALLPSVVSVLPTDYVLDRLLTISERASTVNGTFDRVIRRVQSGNIPVINRDDTVTHKPVYSDVGSVQPTLIQSFLRDIQRCCREAEERLEKSFRPLPPGYELRYDSSP